MYAQSLLEIMSILVLFLLFFWLFIYFEILREDKAEEELKSYPKVALVIPTLFEGEDLKLSINSVLASDYPKDKIKIYVALNRSTDRKTRKVAYSFEKKGVKVVDTGVNGKAAVMNYVIKNFVKEEFVATLDADSMADRKMLRKLLVPFRNKNVGAVTPSVAVYKPKKAVQLIQKYDYIFSIVLRKAFSYVGNLMVAPGPGSMFRVSALKKIGYFDEKNITEDMEIAIHLLTEGYMVENVIDAFSYTIVPDKISVLFKQRSRWYSGFFYNMMKYRKTIMSKDNHGLIDRSIMVMIFTSVFFSIVALPLIAYYIYSWILEGFFTVTNVGVVFSTQTLWQTILAVGYSFDVLSLFGIFLLVFGLYSLFFSLKGVMKRIDAIKDTIGIAIYVTLFSYFLGMTWLYGFVNGVIFRKRVMWKIANRN